MSSREIAERILKNSNELDRLRKELEEVLLRINKMHKKLQTTPAVVQNPDDNSLSKLKMLYIHAKELSEREVTVSNQLLGQLDALLPSGTPARPRRTMDSIKKRKDDSDVSRVSLGLRSRLESLANLKGEEVAARVTQEDAGEAEWFVVKVIHFDKETREFEVLDEEPEDDEESSGPRKYRLPMSHIIPFPKRTDPLTTRDIPSGKHVLAVYPETTALYKATVVQARKGKTDDYVLEFDDDEEDGFLPQRSVPFHRVVPIPEGYRQ